MGISLRPAKWNFFALASSNRTSRNAKGQFKELIFSSILICWDIYIAKSLQPKKVIVLDNNDCCKGWTLNGTLQKDFSSAIFAEPKPFCKVPLRVHPLPHSFLSTKRTILVSQSTALHRQGCIKFMAFLGILTRTFIDTKCKLDQN